MRCTESWVGRVGDFERCVREEAREEGRTAMEGGGNQSRLGAQSPLRLQSDDDGDAMP
jgi:hypothetical protein